MFRFNSIAFLCFMACTSRTDSLTSCPKRNTYLNIDGSCDGYVECRNFILHQKLCPDGLNYNPSTKWPEYPCGYPDDVPCTDRAVSEPSKPTAECPRQFGFFPSHDANGKYECEKYRMCVEGKSIDMSCPSGLVFNIDTSRCNWPEEESPCKATSSFKCPPGGDDESGNPIVTNHQYGKDCTLFVSCQKGNGRILSCDAGLAFNGDTGRCEDADDVLCGDSNVDAP